jgi:predicted acylesterase/phospholipase RssA
VKFQKKKTKHGARHAHDTSHVPARLALIKASTVTPELAWSLQPHKLLSLPPQSLGQIRDLCRPELIWCDTDLKSRAHLEPLVHLLAGTIARDLQESATVVCLGPSSTALLFHPTKVDGTSTVTQTQHPDTLIRTRKRLQKEHLIRLGLPEPKPAPAGSARRPKVSKPTNDTRAEEGYKKRTHVFVFDPTHPGLRSGALDSDVTFDRIVHLTADVPREVPDRLRGLLDPGVFNGSDPAPYYTSFIATVPVARDVRQRGGRGKSFKARTVRFSESIPPDERYQYLDRLERDACVLPVDLDTVVAAWTRWQDESISTPFVHSVRNGISRESLSRWGRAVTNRRVGLAISGGGACAYRVGPLLTSLDKASVPVDVYAGLSGGALIGAFYCHSGLPGFRRIVALGPFIQLTEGIAPFTTYLMEKIVDLLLGHTRVEDLEVRFAAVAVALPPDDPPMTQVVVNGTLGEAARVSGTLPPMFAPTIKGGMRYTDGGAGSIVPSQVARDFGADIVLACNAIPGPTKSNPIWPCLRPWFRIWQRPIDGFAWYAYFWRQASQRFLREADVAYEFPPEDITMLESNEFIRSREIVERAEERSQELDGVANNLRKAWEKLGDRPSLKHLLHAAALKHPATAAARRAARKTRAARTRARQTTRRRSRKEGGRLSTSPGGGKRQHARSKPGTKRPSISKRRKHPKK